MIVRAQERGPNFEITLHWQWRSYLFITVSEAENCENGIKFIFCDFGPKLSTTFYSTKAKTPQNCYFIVCLFLPFYFYRSWLFYLSFLSRILIFVPTASLCWFYCETGSEFSFISRNWLQFAVAHFKPRQNFLSFLTIDPLLCSLRNS